jgi:pimeloyl-ACP methyl ester carboxylesterase
MLTALRTWLGRGSNPRYSRRPLLVLVNGLAEQVESWYCNVAAWRRHFDVHAPNLLAYDGLALHRRIEEGKPVDVDYLVGQLHDYLETFAQNPPYHLVANSLGGKVAVEYVVRHPERVARLVLLCPSGLGGEERLPVVEGVRRNDPASLVDSVFHDSRCADRGLLDYYRSRFADRRWKAGLLRVIRGTMGHRVRDSLARVACPTLLVVGHEDRIVDPAQAIEAADHLPLGKLLVLPGCGHAPQIERAKVVNRLVIDFLRDDRSGAKQGGPAASEGANPESSTPGASERRQVAS